MAGFSAAEAGGGERRLSPDRDGTADRPDHGRRGRAEDGDEGQDPQTLLERVALALERSRIGEYISLTQDPLRLIYLSFLAGMARGLGMVVGFVVLGAITLWVAQRLVTINLPGIGRLIAQLIRIVQENMIR